MSISFCKSCGNKWQRYLNGSSEILNIQSSLRLAVIFSFFKRNICWYIFCSCYWEKTQNTRAYDIYLFPLWTFLRIRLFTQIYIRKKRNSQRQTMSLSPPVHVCKWCSSIIGDPTSRDYRNIYKEHRRSCEKLKEKILEIQKRHKIQTRLLNKRKKELKEKDYPITYVTTNLTPIYKKGGTYLVYS